MRLFFIKGDLLLQKDEKGEYILTQLGETLGKFKNEKRAVAEYNRIRAELEAKMPPAEVTDEDRKKLLADNIADSLVQHNSLRDEPRKKAAKSRTFG